MSHASRLAKSAGIASPILNEAKSIDGPSVLGVIAMRAVCEDGSDLAVDNTNASPFVRHSRLNRVHSLRQLNAMASKRKI